MCLVCAWAAVAAAQLRLESIQPVMLRLGAGSAPATLVNAGAAPAPLSLQAGRFTDDTSQSQLGRSTVVFTSASGAPLPGFVAPGARVRVVIHVSGVTDTGTAHAPVLNQGGEVGRIEVVAADAPMDVTVNGPGSPDHPLALFRGGASELTLRNNDAIAYTLDWSLQIGGGQAQSGELELAPHGTSGITLLPGGDLYSWTDAIHPSFQAAHLTLAMQGPPEVSPNMMPSRTLPVALTLRSLSHGWTTFWSYVFVVVLLLIGGLLSLAGSSILPRVLRKNAMRRELDELAGRIKDVNAGERLDSYLRALLSVGQKRVRLLLKRTHTFSPVAAEALDGCAADIERLRRRLKLTEQLDGLQRKLNEAAVGAPPSAVDGIYMRLQAALVHLRSFAFTEDEVHAAGRALDAEETALAALDDADAQARAIAANFRDLKGRQKFVPVSYYADLKAAVPGLFDLTAQPFDDFRNIPHRMMFAIDFGISAIQAAFDFAMLRASAPPGRISPDTGGGSRGITQNARDRMAARQPEFVALLRTLSWASVHEMRSLLKQMRENVYEEDLLAAINATGQAEIARYPQSVRPWRLVRFFLHFKDARLNDTEALRRLSCKWEFPGEAVVEGSQACHFFHKGGKPEEGDWESMGVPVSVRIESRESSVVAGRKPVAHRGAHPGRNLLSSGIMLEKADRPSYSPVYAEGARFLIALGVALAALLAGVLGQIDRMGFAPAAIAILLIGFGADTVKNLLAQGSRKAAS